MINVLNPAKYKIVQFTIVAKMFYFHFYSQARKSQLSRYCTVLTFSGLLPIAAKQTANKHKRLQNISIQNIN